MMVGSSEDKWRGEAFRIGGALLEHTNYECKCSDSGTIACSGFGLIVCKC